MATIRPARDCFVEYTEQAGSPAEIAKFCHVRPEAVLSWQNGTWPRGEQLYLLWAFLEFQGYMVEELTRLPKPTRQLLLIIANGEISFEDVQEQLGYSNLSSVYRLFMHGSGLTQSRAWKLEQLVKRHQSAPAEPQQGIEEPLCSIPVLQQSESVKQPRQRSEDISSLARLLRLVVKRSGDIEPEELKRQLRDVPPEEIEAFALLLLEIV